MRIAIASEPAVFSRRYTRLGCTQAPAWQSSRDSTFRVPRDHPKSPPLHVVTRQGVRLRIRVQTYYVAQSHNDTQFRVIVLLLRHNIVWSVTCQAELRPTAPTDPTTQRSQALRHKSASKTRSTVYMYMQSEDSDSD